MGRGEKPERKAKLDSQYRNTLKNKKKSYNLLEVMQLFHQFLLVKEVILSDPITLNISVTLQGSNVNMKFTHWG